jgi:signal transduction histidine kinase
MPQNPERGGRKARSKGARRAPSIGGLVLQFALAGLAVVVLLGALGVALLRRSATTAAARDAKQLTRLAGEGIVQPNLSDGVLRGDKQAIAKLDRIVRERVNDPNIVRIKVWTADGRIVYSNEPRLIGATYPLPEDLRKSLRAGGVDAEVSDLSRPENRYERGQGKLLEVYFPIRSRDGRPLAFEAYTKFSAITDDSRDTWTAVAPALIGGLLLLWLVQVPLAWRMARRLQAGQEDREALLLHAIEASDVERRRIAAHLHDGAVQSLAGTAYGLSAAADADPDGARAETLRRSSGELRQVVRELRALLVDIYPPTLRQEGLEAGISDLTAPLAAQGVEATIAFPDRLDLPVETEALLFRVAQEALRNVAKHAKAKHVRIELSLTDSSCTMVIADDGLGMTIDQQSVEESGHFGLRLLADLARDAGGELDLNSAEGRGTKISLELPL